MFKSRKVNQKLTEEDIIKFLALKSKFNPTSDIYGVITKNFKETLKYVKKKYNNSYTFLSNEKTKSILILKEDFLEKYIIIDTLEELTDSIYKFKAYI